MVDWCAKNNVTVIPGVSTVSEVMLAANNGLTLVKAFPFGALGGTEFFENISGPFPDIKFVATGFMGHKNMELVSSKKIAAVGGVWMFQEEDDHTVFSEEEIISKLNLSIEAAKKYKNI